MLRLEHKRKTSASVSPRFDRARTLPSSIDVSLRRRYWGQRVDPEVAGVCAQEGAHLCFELQAYSHCMMQARHGQVGMPRSSESAWVHHLELTWTNTSTRPGLFQPLRPTVQTIREKPPEPGRFPLDGVFQGSLLGLE